MTKRKALGAGLEALLSDKQAVESKKSVQKTPGKQKQSAQEILKIPRYQNAPPSNREHTNTKMPRYTHQKIQNIPTPKYKRQQLHRN